MPLLSTPLLRQPMPQKHPAHWFPKQFIEKYKTVMPLVNLFQHLFYSQYFRIEMAATISQRIRQIDRSKNTIEHRTNHRGSRYRKSGMSQPYSRCYCLQSRGFTRHIRPGKDTDIPILHLPIVRYSIFHLRMIEIAQHKLAIISKRRKAPTFRHCCPMHGTNGIQLIYNRKKSCNGMISSITENVIQTVGPVKAIFLPAGINHFPNSVA